MEATAEECAALAERFDLRSLGGLAAEVRLAVVDPRIPRIRASGRSTRLQVEAESGIVFLAISRTPPIRVSAERDLSERTQVVRQNVET